MKNIDTTVRCVVIGDTCVDTFIELSVDDASVLCDLDRHACRLSMEYGAKIPVANLVSCVGGNAANVAVSLSRLGLPSYLLAQVGVDRDGDRIRTSLQADSVVLGAEFQSTDTVTNANTIIRYDGERTILSYHTPRTYQLPAVLPNSTWYYITSMKDGYQPMITDLLHTIEAGAQIVYQPGTLQLQLGMENSRSIIERSALVVMNWEEAAAFTKAMVLPHVQRMNRLDQAAFFCLRLLLAGASQVIITDGSRGAVATDGVSVFHAPIPENLPKPYETTGAGDAFTSGTVAGLLSGLGLAQAMAWGQAQATSVVSQVGAQAGLLDAMALQELVAQNPLSITYF
jgi:sugar/nucleoside kinase (ribokinase family)